MEKGMFALHACAHTCAFAYVHIGIGAQLREGELCRIEFH